MDKVALHQKIDRFTVSPCGDVSTFSEEDQNLIVIPSGFDLQLGFKYAKNLLAEMHNVRLIGDGVTLRHVWPAWVANQGRLLLTELGAYNVWNIFEVTRELRLDIKQWLDQIFKGVIPGIDGNSIFYGSAAQRFLQPMLQSFPVLIGLVERHGPAKYYCVDDKWLGFDQFKILVERTGGSLKVLESSRKQLWPAKLWPVTFVMVSAVVLILAVLDQLNWFFKADPSRKKLRQLRQSQAARPHPRLWVALIPDWLRINRHVLDSVALPKIKCNEDIGILLLGNLSPGLRSEANMRAHVGNELWPGLGELRFHLEKCIVDQVGTVESLAELFTVLFRSIVCSIRIIFKLANSSRQVYHGSFHVDLSKCIIDLVKLITKDVFNATASEYATRAVLKRYNFKQTRVVFCGSALVSESLADLFLQHAGATTIDLLHGTGALFWIGMEESQASMRGVWTYHDVRAAEMFGSKAVAIGIPWGFVSRSRVINRRVRNILISSGYAHLGTVIQGCYRFVPFQNELIEVVKLIHGVFRDRFCFRWRPHPADNKSFINKTLESVRNVELSRNISFAEDLTWCDLLISSVSTTLFESLFASVPIFVHVIPFLSGHPAVANFDQSRCFFLANDLLTPFTRSISQLDAGDPEALAPEEQTRLTLFGSVDKPATIENCFSDFETTGTFKNV